MRDGVKGRQTRTAQCARGLGVYLVYEMMRWVVVNCLLVVAGLDFTAMSSLAQGEAAGDSA